MSSLFEALDSVYECMVFDSRDWAACRRDAWLWGVLVGWDPDEPGDTDDAMAELAAKHHWTAENVARLRTLHAAVAEFRRQQTPAEQPEGRGGSNA